jgi:hypothetical protein
MDKPVVRIRVDESGVMALDVNISPGPGADLVSTQEAGANGDGDVLGQIKGARPPRWVELAGG